MVSGGPCHPIPEAGRAEQESIQGTYAHKHPGWELVLSQWDSFGWEMKKQIFVNRGTIDIWGQITLP